MLTDRSAPGTLATMLQSRLSLQDTFILAAVLCAGTLFALEFEFFENANRMSSEQHRITVQEYFVLAHRLLIPTAAAAEARIRAPARSRNLRVRSASPGNARSTHRAAQPQGIA